MPRSQNEGNSAWIFIIIAIVIAVWHTDTDNENSEQETENRPHSKLYKLYGHNVHNGTFLSNVRASLQKFGYIETNSSIEWTLMWAHDYPFNTLSTDLKSHQKVNHIPGSGFITNKVDLATTPLQYIPKAFRLPSDKDALVTYSQNRKNKMFVQKHNAHRHIKVVPVTKINVEVNESFVQEFISNPLLVDGYKFDIGIYTVITSVEPLRLYMYNGDVLLRFCPIKYYPFNASELDKYVVGDDYLPIWHVPSLRHHYHTLDFGMRDSLNAHLESRNKDPYIIWDQIEDAIRLIVLNKECRLAQAMKRYASKRNFFELMRFDFIVDEDLNVYLLEANMSPNLSSAHYPPNKILYLEVLHNIFTLLDLQNLSQPSNISFKNIATYAKECASDLCEISCVPQVCQLCRQCISKETELTLKEAFREFRDRANCKRIFPPEFSQDDEIMSSKFLDKYSPENQLHVLWFYGKCQMDASWC